MIKERWRHNYDVFPDLNRSEIEDIYDYEIIEKNHLITQTIGGKYIRHNELFRLVKNADTGELLREDFVTENNALMITMIRLLVIIIVNQTITKIIV